MLSRQSDRLIRLRRCRPRVQLAEPTDLIIRCLDNPAAYVRLYDRFAIDQDGIGSSVEAHAGACTPASDQSKYGSGMSPIRRVPDGTRWGLPRGVAATPAPPDPPPRW
jgi:hypothetical protein